MSILGNLINSVSSKISTRISQYSNFTPTETPTQWPPDAPTSPGPLHPRYEPCQVLSANGIPNVVWLEDALAAHDDSLWFSDLTLLVANPRRAADTLLSSGGCKEVPLSRRIEDEVTACWGGIRLVRNEAFAYSHAIDDDGILLISADDWRYDLAEGASIHYPGQADSTTFVPPLPRLISSFLGYWLRIPEDEYRDKRLWSSAVGNLISWVYHLRGSKFQLVRQPDFAASLDPDVLELHYDLISDYPGRMTIGAYRKHEYHALRHRQIHQGLFTPRPFSSLRFPSSLAEYPELTGLQEELKPTVSAEDRYISLI